MFSLHYKKSENKRVNYLQFELVNLPLSPCLCTGGLRPERGGGGESRRKAIFCSVHLLFDGAS